MFKLPFRALRRFDKDQRGNVAVLFAFSMVPLIGLLGGAVDVARHQRYKVEIANAMDAAALALVRRGAKTDAEADDFVNSYVTALLPGGGQDKMLHMARFDAIQISGGYRVVGHGTMDTAFLPVVGIEEMTLDLSTEVQTSGGKYEIALALDNTGSMRNYGRIGALRDAATDLVDNLYKGDGTKDRVKMALVPFVTAVNVGHSEGFDSSFIDRVGADPVFQKNFSQPVDRLSLFDKMHVKWAGCVEARIDHDLDDTAPTTAETRWVPYLWPDEPDSGYSNSYLTDSRGLRNDSDKLRDVAKYNVGAGVRVVDTSNNGPNAACPSPVVPLTNDADLMKQEISKMKPHNEYGGNNSGTNIAQGLAWAWRVLSPEKPFTGGAPYDDVNTQKVLVLLSDGRNQVVPNSDITKSDYTSFGYLADGRMGSTNDYLVAEANVDEKVKEVCSAVKAKGIRLYTILFQVDFAKTQDLFRNCASKNEEGEPLYYYVPQASDLESAFQDIGKDLTTLRITR
jgi:Mg-chelatase subunit ChlD